MQTNFFVVDELVCLLRTPEPLLRANPPRVRAEPGFRLFPSAETLMTWRVTQDAQWGPPPPPTV